MSRFKWIPDILISDLSKARKEVELNLEIRFKELVTMMVDADIKD